MKNQTQITVSEVQLTFKSKVKASEPMEIRCRHCGEYFCPYEDTLDLITKYLTLA